MIKAAVLGYGTVGSGVYNVIRENRELINERAGQEIEIKYVLDLRKFPGDPVEKVLTDSFDDIVNDPEVKIVVEVMGGTGAAYEFTKRSLEAGKNVCTSNKELVAEHGLELMSIARENEVNYFFEASCGGGIPIIRAINDCLTADAIDQITGILNGTTNFILTKMIREQMPFEEALKLAQENGYAEADPTADIEGIDAQRKICILGSLVYGRHIYPEMVHHSGISGITLDDVEYAENAGYGIKLIGSVKKLENGKEYLKILSEASEVITANYSRESDITDIYKDILFKLKDGEYNGILETGDRYFIVYMAQTYNEELSQKRCEELEKRMADEVWTAICAELNQKAKIVLNYDYYDTLVFSYTDETAVADILDTYLKNPEE